MVKCVDVETPQCGDVDPQCGGFTQSISPHFITSAPQFQFVDVDVWKLYIVDPSLKGKKSSKFKV